MFICEYGHVILNDFIPMGCVQKGLKVTALDSFTKRIWYFRKREHQGKNLLKSLENS